MDERCFYCGAPVAGISLGEHPAMTHIREIEEAYASAIRAAVKLCEAKDPEGRRCYDYHEDGQRVARELADEIAALAPRKDEP